MKKKEKKKKFNAAVLGGNFTGLISAAIMASHGAKVLVIEKNRFLGGKLASFKISHNNKIYNFEREFCGFSYNPLIFERVFYDELKLNHINFLKPKIKLTIFLGNKCFKFENNFLNSMKKFKHIFPLYSKEINLFTNDLATISSDITLLKSFNFKYSTGYNFLKKYFSPKSEIFNILAMFAFFNDLSLKKVDSGFFLNTLVNNLYNDIVYPQKGLKSILKELIKNIYSVSGEIVSNTRIDKGIITREKASTFRLISPYKKQNITIDKYLIGLDIKHFCNDIMKFSSPYLKKYKTYINDFSDKLVKIIFHVKLKSNFSELNLFSFRYLINENNSQNDLIDNFETNPESACLLINNYTVCNNINSKIKETLNIEFLDDSERWEKLINDSKDFANQSKNYISTLKEIIFARLNKIFKNFDDYVEYVYVSTPFEYIKKFNSLSYSNNGVRQDKNNKYCKKTLLMPLVNCYINSKFGNPGGSYFNAIENAYNSYHAFDIKYKGSTETNIDVLNAEELLLLMQKKYKFFKKYNNKILGFHLDHEISFSVKLTQSKLIIKQCSFDEAFNSDFYIFCNLGILKNIMQRRSSMTKEVLLNNFRVKGGVWLLKRVLKRTNLFHIDDKDVKKYKIIGKKGEIPKTKLYFEELKRKQEENEAA